MKYEVDREIGLHYQIHRGIGVHHNEALQQKRPFYVNCSIGGSPSMTLSAVMPLPEGNERANFRGRVGWPSHPDVL